MTMSNIATSVFKFNACGTPAKTFNSKETTLHSRLRLGVQFLCFAICCVQFVRSIVRYFLLAITFAKQMVCFRMWWNKLSLIACFLFKNKWFLSPAAIKLNVTIAILSAASLLLNRMSLGGELTMQPKIN